MAGRLVDGFLRLNDNICRPRRFNVDVTNTGAGTVPAAVANTVTVVEYGNEAMHQTVFTLTDMPQTVVNGTEYQGTQIYDFPDGKLHILGVTATLAQKTTSILADTLNASSTGAISLGTATASSTTLASTMVNLLPSTAFTSSATINVAGTAVGATLAAAAVLDGHTTAVDMYLNTAYATTGDVDADATQTISGTITVTWANLGDY